MYMIYNMYIYIYLIIDERINCNIFTKIIGNAKSFIDDSSIYWKVLIINFSWVYPFSYKGRKIIRWTKDNNFILKLIL